MNARAEPQTAWALERILRNIAPFHLAADWDNVGLLAGVADWPADNVLLALDLTDAVAEEALRSGANALVLYHPPIFKGIRRITAESEGPTSKLPDLLAQRVSIFALHTALDAAVGGTNDVLLDAFETAQRWPLEPISECGQLYKLVTFAPPAEVAGLRAALCAAGAGQIGHYDECSFELDGRGTFRGDETTNPSVGKKLRLESVNETRLELVVPRHRLAAVVAALHATHSYEAPAYDLYPLHTVEGRGAVGMGRLARLRSPTSGKRLVRQLTRIADLSRAVVVGDLKRTFTHVLAAAGSFGVEKFRAPNALVITGEFKHHDALTLLRWGVTAIVLGHAESERPVLRSVRERLTALCPGVAVRASAADAGPFFPLRSRG